MHCKKIRNKILLIFSAILLGGLFLVAPESYAASPKKKFTVVIDAGHGGHDVGAAENGEQEKDINLAVALKLGGLIKSKLKDTEVIFTRNGDYFLSLQKRADIANKAKADLFISIHTNSVDKSNTNRANVMGASTYVLGLHKDSVNLGVTRRENSVIELDEDDAAHFADFDPSQDESHIIFEMTQKQNLKNSIRFAGDVQKEMEKAGRKNRGVHQAGFWVLWSTAMPAALIELDFICNPEQAKFLGSQNGQDKLAGAIFNAVKKYEEYYRKNLGTFSVTDSETSNIEETAEQQAATDRETHNTEPNVAVIESSAVGEVKEHTWQDVSKRTANRGQRRPSKAKATGNDKIETAVIEVSTEQPGITIDDSEKDIKTSAPTKNETYLASSSEHRKGKEAKTNQKRESKKPARREKKDSKVRVQRQNITTVYRVQLLASEERIDAKDDSFGGLTPISEIHENNLYKYTYGESQSKEEMDALLMELAEQFPEATVIKVQL